MHEVKGTAKLRGSSFFRRRSHRTYRTAKDHFRRMYYGALDLIVSVIDKRFNHESLRLSWLKLLMVTAMSQRSSFLKHHTAKMLIHGRYQGS